MQSNSKNLKDEQNKNRSANSSVKAHEKFAKKGAQFSESKLFRDSGYVTPTAIYTAVQ